ncbi:VCBS repeat-containing protein [Agromyces sp. C10]|uniref:FG-GAP repeat domain-containing protein n=1 Tax=Agromyces sp. C10 TaxID=2935077 RepID=UPI00200A02A5|nr:VCBS repeat-containing protein [Agromyces sp. C10]MCK8608175.1 VCBS repeat-containing protein [Agromyces sp. C10]
MPHRPPSTAPRFVRLLATGAGAALLLTTAITGPPAAAMPSVAPAMAPVRPAMAPQVPNGGPDRDFDGDGVADVLAIGGTGELLLYRGTEAGPLRAGTRVGNGWANFDLVFAVGDFSGDGRPDVMARDLGGDLFLYRGDGNGGWLGGGRVGYGWQGFTAILGAGDFNGDGTSDVIGRDASGRLLLYPGNGAGGWLPTTQIGSGWGRLKFLSAAGDMDFDGAADVLAVAYGEVEGPAPGCGSGADLLLYSGTGRGGFARSGAIGSGWCPFNTVMGGGDRVLIARDASGTLLRYVRTGPASWASPVVVGTGWSNLRIVT